MGESKRRSAEIEKLKAHDNLWRANLMDDERYILQLSERLDERLVRGRKFSEGCYHLAFFMTHYLKNNGIVVEPIIGWVNDGTWDGVASHAWIEFKGKKTDVSLTYTAKPEAQPTGDMIVHNHIIRRGISSYIYYNDEDPLAQDSLHKLQTNPKWRHVLAIKEAEHRRMLSIAKDNMIEEYLAMSPPGGRYTDLVRIIE